MTTTPDQAVGDAGVTTTSKDATTQTSSSAATTHAYGKLILFGEHFVVYPNVPALVGAVAAYTDCECVIRDETDNTTAGLQVIDDRPAVPDYKVTKQAEGEEAIRLVLQHLQIDESIVNRMTLTFGGTLCAVSGIGASAAQTVSLARALSQTVLKDKNPVMTEEEINQAGYEGEKGYHGTPSGIDNTAATYGGVLKFQRDDTGAPTFIKKKLLEPIRIVYASTGITSSTTKVVGDVRAKKEANEEWFAGVLQKYLDLVAQAEAALDTNDLTKLGALMNENHILCQEITVSCTELDDLVQAARAAGAIGAKMSGTGRGGLMVALTPTEELQNAVAQALENAGAPQVWKTLLA